MYLLQPLWPLLALIGPYWPTLNVLCTYLCVLGTYLYDKYLPAYNELRVLLSSG